MEHEITKERSLRLGRIRWWMRDRVRAHFIRISPHSYRAGEETGFICGVVVGAVFGFVIAVAVVFGVP